MLRFHLSASIAIFNLSIIGQSLNIENITKELTFSVNNYVLHYRLYIPKNTKDTLFPLILFLHGAGERGNDNKKQLTHAKYFFNNSFHKEHPFIFVAPQCPLDERWVEVSWRLPTHSMPVEPSKVLKTTKLLLDSLITVLPVDTHRIYITGLSMGGFGVWDAISRWPKFFAAAMPVCGGGDEEQACKIKHIPVRAFHGMLDRVVLPERTLHMTEAIRACGGDNINTILYPHVAHDAWTHAYQKENLLWLLQQRKP